MKVFQNRDNYTEKSVWLSFDALLHFSVRYKSCRQVLTPVNNSQLILKLLILDKNWYTPDREKRALMALIHIKDEHYQALAIFTTTLSSDIFVDCVNQHHYHITIDITSICSNNH
jgi:hypothetical protein